MIRRLRQLKAVIDMWFILHGFGCPHGMEAIVCEKCADTIVRRHLPTDLDTPESKAAIEDLSHVPGDS